jgi:hypothetical protein
MGPGGAAALKLKAVSPMIGLPLVNSSAFVVNANISGRQLTSSNPDAPCVRSDETDSAWTTFMNEVKEIADKVSRPCQPPNATSIGDNHTVSDELLSATSLNDDQDLDLTEIGPQNTRFGLVLKLGDLNGTGEVGSGSGAIADPVHPVQVGILNWELIEELDGTSEGEEVTSESGAPINRSPRLPLLPTNLATSPPPPSSAPDSASPPPPSPASSSIMNSVLYGCYTKMDCNFEIALRTGMTVFLTAIALRKCIKAGINRAFQCYKWTSTREQDRAAASAASEVELEAGGGAGRL